jgi:hypothetical protein
VREIGDESEDWYNHKEELHLEKIYHRDPVHNPENHGELVLDIVDQTYDNTWKQDVKT